MSNKYQKGRTWNKFMFFSIIEFSLIDKNMHNILQLYSSIIVNRLLVYQWEALNVLAALWCQFQSFLFKNLTK